MSPSRLAILLGLFLIAMSVIGLVGWYSLNWVIDPFLMTLVFLGGPFFVGMGIVAPHPQRDVVKT